MKLSLKFWNKKKKKKKKKKISILKWSFDKPKIYEFNKIEFY